MLRYEELVQDIKPDIVAGTAACEEVRGSKKFAKILELILLFGNYMNSGGGASGQDFGFQLSFLTKVCLGSTSVETNFGISSNVVLFPFSFIFLSFLHFFLSFFTYVLFVLVDEYKGCRQQRNSHALLSVHDREKIPRVFEFYRRTGTRR